MQESSIQQLKISQTPQIQVDRTNSQYLAEEAVETDMSCIRSQDEAYQQLVSKWGMRQKQSFNNQTGRRQTIYIYDPNNIDFSVYQKPVSEERSDIFAKYTPEIWRYLNSKFIVQEIIQPIQKYKVLNQQILQHVEFLYLLSFRAWSQMNIVMKAFNQKKSKSLSASLQQPKHKRKISQQQIQFIFNSQDINMKYLVDPMIKFYIKIQTIFDYYHKILTERQNYFKYKLKAITDYIFHYRIKINQDKFMCGFEGTDFTREEQIQFMSAFYAKYILSIFNTKEQSYFKNLVAKLSVMSQLLKTKVEKMEGYDDFDRIKMQMINNWKKKQDSGSKQ